MLGDKVTTRRQMIVGSVFVFGSLAAGRLEALGGQGEEISHSAEAIHQTPAFKAGRKRVYRALTDAAQFHQLTQLGEAAGSDMAAGSHPTEISPHVGGAFTLFGGHIEGRHVELVPDRRIVQAWRASDWPAGVYSIARFELADDGAGTRLVFDHTGFPVGQAEHLAAGWKAHYWVPLRKLLA